MKDTLKLMQEFETRNNINVTLEINSDGSGNVRNFWDEEIIKTFDSTDQLESFLANGKLKQFKDGYCARPIEIINE